MFKIQKGSDVKIFSPVPYPIIYDLTLYILTTNGQKDKGSIEGARARSKEMCACALVKRFRSIEIEMHHKLCATRAQLIFLGGWIA